MFRVISRSYHLFFSPLLYHFMKTGSAKTRGRIAYCIAMKKNQLNSEIISRDIILIVWEPRKKIILAIFPVTAKRKKPQKNQIKSCVTTHLN